MSQVSIIPGAERFIEVTPCFLKYPTAVAVLPGVNVVRMKMGHFHLQKWLQVELGFKNGLFPLSETLLKNGRWMEQLMSVEHQVWKNKTNVQIEWRPGEKCSEEPTHHCKMAAKKSGKHRSSCSQDNNATYIKQQRPTWQSWQKEAFPTISTLNLASEVCKRKHWEAWSPFGTMCFGYTDKTKI